MSFVELLQALEHKEVTDEIENTIKKLVTIIESFQVISMNWSINSNGD